MSLRCLVVAPFRQSRRQQPVHGACARVVQVAAISLAVTGLPHLAYHATTTSHYSTGDNIASLFGLALDVLLPLAILYLASDDAQRPVSRQGARVEPGAS